MFAHTMSGRFEWVAGSGSLTASDEVSVSESESVFSGSGSQVHRPSSG